MLKISEDDLGKGKTKITIFSNHYLDIRNKIRTDVLDFCKGRKIKLDKSESPMSYNIKFIITEKPDLIYFRECIIPHLVFCYG